jgi:hypothetical protein
MYIIYQGTGGEIWYPRGGTEEKQKESGIRIYGVHP